MKDFDSWRRTYFSDECSFERGSGKNREWSFRYLGEQWEYRMIQETRKGHDISQMFFAFIYFEGRSDLINMGKDIGRTRHGYTSWSYIDALERSLLYIYKPGYLWQQDNAPIHTAGATKEWLESHRI